MTRVFVVAPLPPRLDATDLLRHGSEVVSLIDYSEINPHDPQAIMDLIQDRFEEYDFDPSKDILAISGDYFLLALMMRVSGEYDLIKIAVFRPQDSKYFIKEVE